MDIVSDTVKVMPIETRCREHKEPFNSRRSVAPTGYAPVTTREIALLSRLTGRLFESKSLPGMSKD